MKTGIIRISKAKAILQCCLAALIIAAAVCGLGSSQVHAQIRGIAQQFMTNILSWESI